MPMPMTWRWLVAMATALLLGLGLPSQAWDATAMQSAARQLGPGAVAAVPALQAMLAEARGQDDRRRLDTVNQFFNSRIDFRSDQEVWGQEDYWASPLQALHAGRGDCEDFVIAKYASLLATGMPPDQLRLVYVRARLPDLAQPLPHMVLAWYPKPGAEPLILDSLKPDVQPASQRPDLTPVFSFNSVGLWQGVAGAAAGDPMARLSRWRDVWNRTRLEGFP